MSTVFSTGLPNSSTLTLQCCKRCGQVNYPTRELCGNCLGDELQWLPVSERGTIQSQVQLHYSPEAQYAGQLPWPVASVKLDCGPVLLAHVQPGISSGAVVALKVIQDGSGNRMLVANAVDAASQQSASTWLDKVGFKEIST